MSHIALYRAWRPQTFQDMVGQQHIIQTLQNAIREDRVSHAYLFNGPRGTGKTTTAKVLAKAINCERGPAVEPCNECEACLGINAGHIMDVIEIDAASNRGIDEIRDIREKVRYAPSDVRFKVYIIDEVHMLTTEAFNALLKTLEEPPGHVIFILATTEPHKLPATIISRCQRFDFRQISLEEQSLRLTQICRDEGISADADAVAYIARLSEGGMRDAISLLEQVAAFSDSHITLEAAVDVTGGITSEHFYKLAEAVRDGNASGMLTLVEELMLAGKSADKCMENLIYYFRDLLVLKLAPGGGVATDRVVDAEKFGQMASSYSSERLFVMIDVLNRYQTELRHASQPQTLFEVALMKLCTMNNVAGSKEESSSSALQAPSSAGGSGASNAEVGKLRQQVDALERKLESLMRSGVAAGGTESQAGASRPAAGGGSRPGMRPFGGSGAARAKVKLDAYLAAANSDETTQARLKWGDVLHRVKAAKVTLHAWLKDGELASVADGKLLLAFKNEIHRETTEKQNHRELIESVAQEVLGSSVSLVTVMQKDWQAGLDQVGDQPSTAASADNLELLEGFHAADKAAEKRPEWVEEAVKLFGEDLVVVKNNES
ncbi:DNA polymerase III subunit gamma/tau [Paenibacillus sp. HB172176]|uniref:DNA polymerase III subunit gamma/tau n=1 Tax=Paenibacillus sp. HB172176 TaxID=2493690 RepID=UPI00143872BD|nr:DNA polymerase III subunit gamma/tau [Paenibacillus sp. HB172176]